MAKWELTKAFALTIVLDDCKGDDREEYMRTAARERRQKLGVSFGEDLWNVALEPGRRMLLRGKRGRLQ